jgi:hypothetical protein
MTRPTLARLGALIAVMAILIGACSPNPSSPAPSASAEGGTTAPTATAAPSDDAASPAPSGEAEAIFDAIEAQVLELRGLDPVDVPRTTIGEEELATRTAADFDKDNPEDYVLAIERLYKALGLMPEADSLRDLYLELLASQVAGFYDPEAKELFVVSRSGQINGADKITFAHEYGHALQDANFDIFKAPEELRDQSDQAAARAAMYEGDATLLMLLWAQGGNMTPEEIQEYIAAGSDPESLAILERMPQILVQGLLFPYESGAQFVLPIQTTDGWAGVDALYERPPTTTEQILHPEKYEAQEAAIEVDIPDDVAAQMGDGWSVALEDSWGEFQTRVWLTESGVPVDAATDAAAGWGGDRVVVLTGPDGAWAVALDTTWDTAADAEAFRDAAETAVGSLDGDASVVGSGEDVTVLVGSDPDALLALDKIFGDTGA